MSNIEIKKVKTALLDKCPFCRSPKINLRIQGQDYETKTGLYSIYECYDCKLNFTNPQPLATELSKLYETRTTKDFPTSTGLANKLRGLRVDNLAIKILQRCLKKDGISVLDFGCGDGFLSERMAFLKQVNDVVAVDFHSNSPQIIRESSAKNLKYIELDLFQKNRKAEFDLIVCRHVLEHIHDVTSFITMIRGKMKNGGSLLVEVPNFDSVWRLIFQRYYHGLYLPRHMYHFTAKTLEEVFRQAGFSNLDVSKSNTPIIGASLGNVLNTRINNLGLMGLILFPFQMLTDKVFGQSSTLIIFATKND